MGQAVDPADGGTGDRTHDRWAPSPIVWANDGSAPVLSLDTPSGLSATTGAAAPVRPR